MISEKLLQAVANSDRPHRPHIFKGWFILLFLMVKIRNNDHTIWSMVYILYHRNMYRKFSVCEICEFNFNRLKDDRRMVCL